MRARFFGRHLSFALACASLVGCMRPQLGSREQPVEVTHLQASFRSAEEGRLALTLEVENRDSRAGMVTLVTWELWIQGRFFATGQHATRQVLPLGGKAAVVLEVPLSFRGVPVEEGEMPLTVGLRGGVHVRFGGDEQRLPYEAVRRIVFCGAPSLGRSLE